MVNDTSSEVPACLLLAESRLRPVWTSRPQGEHGGAMAGASVGGAIRCASGGGKRHNWGASGKEGGGGTGADMEPHLNRGCKLWWCWALDKGERCGDEKGKIKRIVF